MNELETRDLAWYKSKTKQIKTIRKELWLYFPEPRESKALRWLLNYKTQCELKFK